MLKDIETFLLEQITAGTNTAGAILKVFPDSLVLKSDKFRTIDSGLRRLVKQGKIKFSRKTGWAVLPAEALMSEKSLVNPV